MEHVALYTQFRPKNFDEIVEQKAAVTTLKQTVKIGKIGHAYLFHGQRGTGKTSIARVFARAINCENPVNGNPCNTCSTCKGILDGSLMDVIEIDAASNRSIDNIRKICEEVTYAPSKAPHKIYIIDEVHMITQEGFNALLKTLEEPPAHAVFLFATTEPHSIPSTILSRCQKFEFKRIPQESIISRLKFIADSEKINITEDALTLIASLSDGAMRDAISMLDQAGSSANGALIKAETIEDMTGSVNKAFLAEMAETIIDGKYDKLLILCGQLTESGRDTIQFTLDLAQYFRDLLVVRTMPDPTTLLTASPTTLKRMYEVASKTNSQTLVALISSLSRCVSELKWSPSVRTSFEITLLRLCGRKIKADEVPLVIPDFAKKQAEAVPVIEAKFATAAETPAPVTEAPAIAPVAIAPVEPTPAPAAPEVKPAVDESKLPPIARMAAPEPAPAPVAEAPKAEEVKEEAKEEAPKTETLTPVIPEPKEEIVTIAPSFPVSDEEEIEEAEESDEPMENQIDIFSLASVNSAPAPETNESLFAAPSPSEAPKAEPLKSVAPVFDFANTSSKAEEKPATESKPLEKKEEPKKGKNIFAGLSSNFLDDIKLEEEKPHPEVTFPADNNSFAEVYQPTGRIGETKKTRLSAVLDTTPIAESKVVKEITPEEVWAQILETTRVEDFTLSAILEQAKFLYEDNSAFIIFDNEDKHLIENLKSDPQYKKISTEIKQKIPTCIHVYLCTVLQYQNMQLVKNGADPRETFTKNTKAEDFLNSTKQLGIDTEIHFGDQ